MSRLKIFVGGVHGAGKSSVCNLLVNHTMSVYVSASNLLQWNDRTKQVKDISHNQQLLLDLLITHTNGDFSYVVDGHFALWNENTQCEAVPVDFFRSLNINAIVLTTCDSKVIQQRLIDRDKENYSLIEISQLQKLEVNQALSVSEILQIPLYVFNTTEKNDYNELIHFLNKMKTYTRENILSPMLKVVVFRIDFTGLTSLEEFINRIKAAKMLQNSFRKMVMIPKQSMSVSFRPKDIAEGQLPYTEAQKSKVYRFFDCKIQNNSDVTLDLEEDSITLAINCEKGYYGSLLYSQFVAWIISELRLHDSFVSINRLGVRKIDVQVLNEGESIGAYFNENYSVSKSWQSIPNKSKSVLTELIEKDNINFNVTQHIDITNDGKERLIYDVDAFLQGQHLSMALIEGNVEELLYHDMQDLMFDLFTSVASSEYLEKCKQTKK